MISHEAEENIWSRPIWCLMSSRSSKISLYRATEGISFQFALPTFLNFSKSEE
jgi:hypothetical protein